MNELDEIYDIQNKWNSLVRNVNLPKSLGKNEMFHRGLIFYLSDLHIESNIDVEADKENQIKDLVDRIVKNSPELYAVILRKQRKKIEHDADEGISLNKEARVFAETHDRFCVLIGGDVSNCIENATIFYRRLRKWVPSNCKIIAVLGNHELSQYSSVEEAYSEYRKMFEKEKILFLQNNGYTHFRSLSGEREVAGQQGIENWPENDYSFDDFVFFGGVGFNKYDKTHNTKNIITSADLQGDSQKEKEKCDEFLIAYNKALEYSLYFQKVLVVMSHYPLRNWMNESECDNSCYYFYGHNHKNEMFKSNGAYVFADNQIGYRATHISFKYVDLCGLYNPFYNFPDGIYSVNVGDYELFYKFSGEAAISSRNIRKYLDDGYNLKMIKKKGYYGFFIVGQNRVFICKGGRVEELNSQFDYYCENFEKMTEKYTERLTPFRTFQMKLSEEVKNIGGSGRIHGLIIDYDFCHHIMISPVNNQLYFYYSPESGYGTALNLKNVIGLLNHTGINEITKARYIMNMQPNSILSEYISSGDEDREVPEDSSEVLQIIDIKNSPYAISIRMRNIERIFTSGILRDWDDKLINEFLIEED